MALRYEFNIFMKLVVFLQIYQYIVDKPTKYWSSFVRKVIPNFHHWFISIIRGKIKKNC